VLIKTGFGFAVNVISKPDSRRRLLSGTLHLAIVDLEHDYEHEHEHERATAELDVGRWALSVGR
jgi:hypothetical protein